MATTDPILRARARLGTAHRWGSPEEAEAARRDLAAALIAKTITQRLAEAPPLLPEQRAALIDLIQDH